MKLPFTFLFFFTFGILFSQDFNVEIAQNGVTPKLIGKFNKEGLSTNSYASWFNKNYEDYKVADNLPETMGNELSKYRIELYMGTWCGDSKREVPRFYKVLDELNFPLERLTSVAVNNDSKFYKQSPGGEHEGKNIHRVPTFIFYKNGKEVNRIVESPRTTLEEDIQNILSGSYTPNYESVHWLHEQLTDNGDEILQKRSKKLVKQLQPLVDRVYDLNTYASVLYYSGRTSTAIEVLRLNLKLFPQEAYAYASLGSKLGQTGSTREGITLLEQAIELDPENDRYKSKLEELRGSM